MKREDFFSKKPPLTISEEWQIKNGLKRFLRPKDVAIKKYLDFLKYRNCKKILDHGCANGVWLERVLTETKAKGIGVDIASDLIKVANSRIGKRGSYFNSSKSWPVAENSIDLCISFDVVEHLRDRKKEISKLAKSIKKGGKLLIFTLNPDNKYTFDWLFEVFGSDWLYKRSDHLKSRFVSPKNLSWELKSQGFTDINYQLYPGPLNLFWDVACYGYLKIFEILMGKNIKKLLNLNSRFVKFIYSKNIKIDKFINKKGHSNGYFLWATKK